MNEAPPQFPSIRILGVRVDMVQIPDVVDAMSRWIEYRKGTCHQVVNTGMHGIMVAHRDPDFKKILNSCDLFFPDGISVIWVARLRGYTLRKKKTGPELLREFCKMASQRGYSNYFYGDTPETLRLMAENFKREFPELKIAGSYSPPFRSITAEEDDEIVRSINSSGADVLWVGLGCPKQERWIFDHKDRLNVPVAAGVGAYFKFHSGQVKRAPAWIGNLGLEWLWRLATEPRRIWRRVLVDGPQFLSHAMLELSGLKKYK
jgi:N-acetylglucosaminyldiphosphoundecaprenol N-acetyl-beta-D-mannosaminyltransferase